EGLSLRIIPNLPICKFGQPAKVDRELLLTPFDPSASTPIHACVDRQKTMKAHYLIAAMFACTCVFPPVTSAADQPAAAQTATKHPTIIDKIALDYIDHHET